MSAPIKVSVTDPETGDAETVVIPPGDYLLICAAPCYRAHVQAHKNGTHVITVKGRTPDLMAGLKASLEATDA